MTQIIDDVATYNNFLTSFDHVYVTQSPQWAQVKDTWSADRFITGGGKDSGKFCAQMLSIAGTNPLSYIPRGPVGAVDQENSVKSLIDLLSCACRRAKERGSHVLRMDPNWCETPETVALLDTLAHEFHGQIRRYPDKTKGQPPFTMVVDVRHGDYERWVSDLKKQRRYELRKNASSGVTSFVTRDQQYLRSLYDLIVKTATRQDIQHRPYEYFERLFAAYEDAFMTVATVAGETVSASLNVPYRDTVYNLYGGNVFVDPKLKPSLSMNAQIVAEAIARNIPYVDLCGVYSLDNADPLYRFKRQLAGIQGERTFVGEVDFDLDALSF